MCQNVLVIALGVAVRGEPVSGIISLATSIAIVHSARDAPRPIREGIVSGGERCLATGDTNL